MRDHPPEHDATRAGVIHAIRLLVFAGFLSGFCSRAALATPNPCTVTGPPFVITCTSSPPTLIPPVQTILNGGNGGNGSDGGVIIPPGSGGSGGSGGNDTILLPLLPGNQAIELPSAPAAVFFQSVGGTGGSGGSVGGYAFGGGADGGSGGSGGTLDITVGSALNLATSLDQTPGIWVESAGGIGGKGGSAFGSLFGGGDGGAGGAGGNVTVNAFDSITTIGQGSYGILAESLGGGGGEGGLGVGGIFGGGGGGGPSQSAGTVTVNLGLAAGGQPGTILTYGANADGILAQSVGGFGGKGGAGVSPVTSGGDGSNGGSASTVQVNTSFDSVITTVGDGAVGILAQSLGAGGGAGGISASLFGAGGAGAPGGAGGTVIVENGATITTSGAAAKGILAQSVGGGGGDGGTAGAVFLALGGQGSATSNGGNVIVVNTGNIMTNSAQSLSATTNAVEFGTQDILAQSVGGGGGNGGGSGGLFSVGGSGGGGGQGGIVTVVNVGGTLVTNASDSDAIFAQSIGGGGGNGGGAVAVGAILSAAIGGSAGIGSPGSNTSVVSNGGTITTNGDRSNGIQAQSIGGGGGNGGFAVSTSVGITSTSLAVGGQGGAGGSGSTVEVTNGDPAHPNDFGTMITTNGSSANGIFAQSVGGGGGSGGFSVAAGLGLADSTGISVGGSGGTAGNGATVTVKNDATIQTFGTSSEGIFAQSVGGGGGVGNFSVAGNVSIGAASGFSFGGSGGAAGNGGNVSLTNGGTITTMKASADALEAQSVGGGGGQGGMSVSGGVALGTHLGMSLGGSGGGGGNGGNVTLTNEGTLITVGDKSDAFLAQSVAGGGGNGAFSASVGLSVGPGAGVSIGGGGGSGGTGGTVIATNHGMIGTMGSDAVGLFAQSVAGGGGNGGFSIAGDVSGVGAFDVSVGGGGGSGGTGGNVTVNNGTKSTNADITTLGAQSTGIEAQSVGGGGGNGGFSVGASTGLAGTLDLAIGGSGGAGSSAGIVTVTNFGNITTGAGPNKADGADAILAQSIAHGGGNGGFSIAGGAALGIPISVGVGGSAGRGGTAQTVTVNSTGVLMTNGDDSDGILAQSIGGGGGKGGFDVAGGLSLGASLDLGVGGAGGAGGSGGFVSVTNTGGIMTTGNDSSAISAQSNGGGGGSAAFSAAGGVSAGVSASLSLGGSGGTGGMSQGVNVVTSAGLGSCGDNNPTVGRQCPPKIGTIMTFGDRSDGVNAQSSGGSGGTGGMSFAGSALATVSLDASLGGSGGDGGSAGFVFVEAADNITTTGDSADGINAQSQGGGGGAGGLSVSGSVTTFLTPPIGTANLAIGGSGGNAGIGGGVTVENFGTITTGGAHANAIYAQSQGGTGGNGGFSVAGGLDVGLTPSLDMSVGGSGGMGSQGSFVTVSNLGALTTTGNGADGIYAISQGGGGGKAGLNVAGGITGSVALQLGIGGSGGDGSSAGDVTVENGTATQLTTITTTGSQSDGIFAESIGGNGGNGNFSIAGGVAGGATMQMSLGGSGGKGATSGTVEVDDFGNIMTGGAQSNGIHAQSVGGNGGNGGISIAGGVSPLVSGSLSIGGQGENGADANTATVNFGSFSAGQFGGTIITTGVQSNGIYAQSIGGGGGSGGFSVAGSVTLLTSANLSLGGTGGDAGSGNTATVNALGDIGTKSNDSDGILAQSVGGGGGSGGFSVGGALSLSSSSPMSIGGEGGDGGTGGNVAVTSVGVIGTAGNDSSAIVAQSVGGGGGSGGFSVTGNVTNSNAQGFTVGGVAGTGASAGSVTVIDLNAATAANAPTIFTLGNQSDGILAQSTGGSGGSGGFSVGGSINNGSTVISSIGGLGGTGSTGGTVGVFNRATIFTKGSQSDGIAAESIGGGGGGGGFSVSGTFSSGKATDQSIGGLGGAAGTGGLVVVDNAAEAIVTLGSQSTGVYAESIGGGGGTGGFSIGGALVIGSNGTANSLGGRGGGGGDGGRVTIFDGPLKGAPNFVGTAGNQADGILGQSVGGGGGEGGFSIAGTISNAHGVSQSIGGHGEGAGNGGAVLIFSNTDVITTGNSSVGVAAQSIGGGGGTGGWSVGGGLSLGGGPLDLALGGVGGGGGNGGSAILVSDAGAGIGTSGAQSDGLLAQSIGGGGGTGGFAIAGAITTGYTVGFSLGGEGGGAGTGGVAGIANRSTIVTTGNLSDGIFAQSIGGGGGNGGFAISGSGSVGLAANTSFGGDASGGNDGGDVIVANAGEIATKGQSADAVLAQSAGGGGGNGGFSIAGAATLNRGAEFSFGGDGAAGGDGGTVRVLNTSALLFTQGANANALEAQSLGGGGGNGGFAIQGGITAKGTLNVGFGGSAQVGGDGGFVDLLSGGPATALVRTTGNNANGILAQSVGGGGGSGGFAIGGGISGGLTIDEAFGGTGGGGGKGGDVELISSTPVDTSGTSSSALVAQSIGGGGGDGGFSVAGSLSGDNNASLSFGGGGGTGGRAGTVLVQNSSALLETTGDLSDGILAQGVGGGGGAGGFSITGGGSLGSRAIGLSLGGNGGSGGVGGVANVQSGAANTTTFIVTTGAESDGILEQSIGGGGGSGAFSVEGLASEGSDFGLSVGGSGGTGNNAGGGERGTTLLNYSNIATRGASSNAILVQSIGGGGGSAGFNVDAKVAADSNGFSVAGGFGFGSGGSGGNGETVSLVNHGLILTRGNNANGVVAQSIGGGGGYGGFSFATQLRGNLGLGEGSTNSGGGSGGRVNLQNTAIVVTEGNNASDVVAQSIGGGGGDAGFNIAGNVASAGSSLSGLDLTLGNDGGAGGNGESVTVTSIAPGMETSGINSDGVLAQSIGGGGGDGGFAIAADVSTSYGTGLTLGGAGGNGGTGGQVQVGNSSVIITKGAFSDGIAGQSIGGGGGDGAFAIDGTVSFGLQSNMAFGGNGGQGNDGGDVTIVNAGAIGTKATGSNGILAESIGGGGGDGGFSIDATVSQGKSKDLSFGGSGGDSGSGGDVGVANVAKVIVTTGDDAAAIAAQSIGGGGGDGAFAIDGSFSGGLVLSFGGDGGAGGFGGNVFVLSGNLKGAATSLITQGFNSDGILAQSIGGGGGDGGLGIGGPTVSTPLIGLGVGGTAGGVGSGGNATVLNFSSIATGGAFSDDILAQTIGGGGGSGSVDVSGASNAQVSAALHIGDTLGLGGNGGVAGVLNTKQLTTAGKAAVGIAAQSIGDGGGVGGFIVAGNLTSSSNGGLAIGTAGSSCLANLAADQRCGSGSGGGIALVNSGIIVTAKAASGAMLAQSIGGGGGTGALFVGGNYSGKGAFGIALGGFDVQGGGGAILFANEATGDVETSGFHADGVQLQSIGGGGGAGTIAVGGNVGAGTTLAYHAGGIGTGAQTLGVDGGRIVAQNAATVVTLGNASAALVAQSIGGGGGDGAIRVAGSVAAGGLGLTSLFGGDDISGGTGGDIRITNHGDLGTMGLDSDALLAQSIGGGGGTGGFDGAISIDLTNKAFALVDTGGSDDVGSNGGVVFAVNTGAIVTEGAGSAGLTAQSIGGGGGNADESLNLALGSSGATTLAIGSGGTAAVASLGGDVGVANSARIETGGYDALGLLAQSIGGGGGNDGFTATGTLETGSTTPQLLVDVGADGGVRDGAGAVVVVNLAKVETFGDGSSAIVAQSIGGGGGNSDLAFAGSFSSGAPHDAEELVGGTGNVSGDGAEVVVVNQGKVMTGDVVNGVTQGEFADGILAQSIGGGGGNGGLAIGLGAPASTPATGLMREQLGGSGGVSGGATSSAGSGGLVRLQDEGTVITMGGGANGIEAQSIGGGGGNANLDVFGTATLGDGQAAATYRVLTVVGGGSGIANTGGVVHVLHSAGPIVTFGDASDGILAQSIGGGGGDGGSAHSIAGNPADCSTSSAGCSAQQTGLIVGVGGAGAGQSNDGGAVKVVNSGIIQTGGEDSSAIVAQSIGGGGGVAGDDHTTGGSNLQNWLLAVGGRSASQGSGSTVNVTDSGAILTMGDGSHGVLAQSIGGGGGEAGAGVIGGKGVIVLGGSDGAGGNGGDVTVTIDDAAGKIETEGNGAFGILAQSVGGGGGIAGDLDFGISKTTIGSGSALTAAGGGGGNGGNVTVNDTGDIQTTGNGSDGIFAQSVGGGGGLAGATSSTSQSFAGSAGAFGSAGTVNVTQTGIIATTGNGADAIFAQSAGGTGSGGDVNVTVNGEALAYGANSDGITAQSVGAAGSGNIHVTIDPGSIVQGGIGSGSAAVRMLGTGINTLTNLGTITTAATPVAYPFDFARYAATLQTEGTMITSSTAALGDLMTDRNFAQGQQVAVYASGGTLVLNNSGAIYGAVVTEGSKLDLVNDGVLVTGSNLDFGSGTLTLASSSLMTPGGGGFVANTNLSGNLVQQAGSNYLVTINLASDTTSSFNVSGTAKVGGTVDLDLLDISAPAPGQHVASIITAAGGVTDDGLLLAPPKSAVATFNLAFDPNAVQLDYDVNYGPTRGGVLNADDVAFGGYLGRIALAGGSSNFNTLMKLVFAIPTLPELRDFYERLSPSGSLALSSAALLSNLDFSSAMLSCRDRTGFAATGNCSWGTLDETASQQSATFAGLGYTQHGTGFSTGYQRAVGDGRTSFGAAIRYGDSALGDDSAGSSYSGSGVDAGVLLKRVGEGGTAISASLVGGASGFTSTRAVAYPASAVTASGKQNLWYAGAHLRAERTVLQTGKTSITPFVDFGATRVTSGTLDENGAGIFNARIAPNSQTFSTLQSGASFQSTGNLGALPLRASLDFSLTQIVGNNQVFSNATLAGAPAGVAPFAMSSAIGRTHFDLAPSLSVLRKNGLDIRLGGRYDFSASSHSLGGYLQVGTRL